MSARDALAIADTSREKDREGNIYYRGTLRSELTSRDYRVVLTCIGSAGNPAAAAAVRDVVSRYAPRVVLLMGIAAGIRGKVLEMAMGRAYLELPDLKRSLEYSQRALRRVSGAGSPIASTRSLGQASW